MGEYLAPGVFVEEVDTGSKPIEGVSTSTAGMVGVTERGPVNVPVLVTGVGEFRRWFGDLLNRDDYSDTNTGDHCYLPHAVDGFFTNGGKRLFVVRVLDTAGARRAEDLLFDRGPGGTGPNTADTVLLRTAREQTGTAANPPGLVVLDAFALNAAPAPTFVRLGVGSATEYRQVPAAPANDTSFVPMNFPLARPHGGNGEIFDLAAPTLALTLVDDLAPGARAITLRGSVADMTALAAGADHLLAFARGAAGAGAEYRFVTRVVSLSPAAGGNLMGSVILDAPLVRAYRGAAGVGPADPVAHFTIAAAAAGNVSALESADAGTGVAFVANNAGFNATAAERLLVLDRADPAAREARRVGRLTRLRLATGAYRPYPAGSVVEPVTLADDVRQVAAAGGAAGATSLVLTGPVTGFGVGQRLLVGAPGPNQETVVVRGLTPATNTIQLAAALANNQNGQPVRPVPKKLQGASPALANVLDLDDRVGLNPGDMVRVGAAPDEEYATIAAVPGRSSATTAPDAGTVVLAGPVARPLAPGAEVVPQAAPSAAAGVGPTATALPAAQGATWLAVGDGTAYAANTGIRVRAGDDVTFHRVASVAALTPQRLTVDTALRRGHPAGSPLVGRSALLQVQALDAGIWGNRLRVSVEDEPAGLAARTSIQTVTSATTLRLASAAGVEAGTVLELFDAATGNPVGAPVKVRAVNRASNFTLTLDGAGLSAAQQAAEAAAVAAGGHLGVRSREFRVTVSLLRAPDPAVPSRNDAEVDREVFRYLSMDPRHSRYVQRVVGEIDGLPLRRWDRRPDGESLYVRVFDLANDIVIPADRTAALEGVRLGPEPLIDVLPSGRTRPARLALERVAGDDSLGTLTDTLYAGVDDPEPDNRTGLHSLRNIEEVSIVACPGRMRSPIQQALIDHCELMRYRFAVLDGPRPPGDTLNDVQNQRQQFDTKYAALYHPWLLVTDPYPVNLARAEDYPVPPSGHVAGIYARTDVERGVHKAPANEVVRGALGLRRILNKEQQEILNPYPVNINVIRDFRADNRGIRVYGGRVITSDSDWKYVNVRRLLIFIEASIDRGLQWVVFEPNAEPLWARVRRSISNFLTLVWRNGGLEGTKVEEAYFVKCDRTTMTQTDVDSGRLIVLVGVAPVKPAEFVIVRIGLWTARSEE